MINRFRHPCGHIRIASLLIALSFIAAPQLRAQSADAVAIRSVLEKSADDWNRGDIDAFATSYKNSPDILFMGKTISHGYAEMVAAYHKHYSTRAKMGTLSFSNFAVQPLDAHFSTVTGNYHLDLPATEGSTADGYFLLVLEKTPDGWKIVRDDTTTLAK